MKVSPYKVNWRRKEECSLPVEVRNCTVLIPFPRNTVSNKRKTANDDPFPVENVGLSNPW
jgi:hypothetical protein